MGHKIALVTAVEKYSNKHISQVDFAEADAKGFASAIALHGYCLSELAPSAKATKTTIESHLRRELQRLSADDEFIFYYAGHGFSANGHNFITAYDTDPSDLEKTSVRLQWIFDLVDKNKCERVALFLDSCESGITKLVKRRGLYSSMSEVELDEFFSSAEY
ncbi:MAG TPA: caspase family protein, partial [Terriglobales bacterium]|nr:caspase family protein [Terriglobales bacterium]